MRTTCGGIGISRNKEVISLREKHGNCLLCWQVCNIHEEDQ